MKEKNIYIAILKFGREKLEVQKSFELADLKEYLIREGFAPSQNNFEVLLNDIATRIGGEKYRLSAEAYFNLLEYEELQDARKSSKNAQIWSIVALLISIFTLGCSIYFDVQQLNSTTTINIKQIEEIQRSILDESKTKRIQGILEDIQRTLGKIQKNTLNLKVNKSSE